jgi:hypothetical protein
MTFEVLTAGSMQMAVFWVVASCNVIEVTDVSMALASSIIRTVTS